MTVEVPLTQGQVALIDDEDAPAVLAHKWCASRRSSGQYVATRSVRRVDGVWTNVLMHKFLTGYSQTDHVNRNPLDNRRANLRDATNTQNRANSKRREDNESGYKGVTLDKRRGKWRAIVTSNGTRFWLGYHPTPEAAARAYDAGAIEHFGEFARLNFPVEAPITHQ